METNPSIQTLARARPVRTAFFVPMDDRAPSILDAIFEAMLPLWGGRFSLIVPCDADGPRAVYRPWLLAYDPDVIYSYVDLTDDQQLAIHEDIYPSHLVRHRENDPGMPVQWRPDLPFKPLHVSSVLPLAGMPTVFNPTRGCRIVSAMGTAEADGVLRDNFGSDFTLRNGLRSRLASLGSSLVVIQNDELLPRERYVGEVEETIADLPTLFRSMARSPRDLGLTQLAAMACPRLSVEDLNWGKSFHLVIGGTAADRIMYWNARFFMPVWRDGQMVDFCVPSERFDDADFVAALAELIQSRNHVNDGNNNGMYRLVVTSISLSEDRLEPLREALSAILRGQVITLGQVESLDACVPQAASVEHAALAVNRSFASSTPWKEAFSQGRVLRIRAPEPDHLRYLPPESVFPDLGAWAVDLDIERSVNHSPYDNVHHRWRLPRRLRVAQTFCEHYQLTTPHGPLVGPRVSKGGLITLFSVPGLDLPPITVPPDSQAIISGFQRGRDWAAFDRRNREHMPAQLCYVAERSDAGQHFFGTYQLFGSVRAASSVLLNSFWRTQLAKLGATDQRDVARHDHVLGLLERRLRRHEPQSPGYQAILANVVLQVADAERSTVKHRSWTHLSKDFAAFVERFLAAHGNDEDNAETLAEEKSRYQRELATTIQRMCELTLFHQGYELKCPKCLHRNWIAVQDLREKLPCQVCHTIALAPVDMPWQFRLNGFVRDALQRYGIGPLFWVLGRCQKVFRDSFWFEGPLNIYVDEVAYDRNRPATDVDLTIIHEGKVMMCEAKQSERGWDQPEQLAASMVRLRPDIALIAVMEPTSPELERKFATFVRGLEGSGIEPRMWTLSPDEDIADDPWFFV